MTVKMMCYSKRPYNQDVTVEFIAARDKKDLPISPELIDREPHHILLTMSPENAKQYEEKFVYDVTIEIPKAK